MDIAAEMEQIGAEALRRSAMLMDEIDEIDRRTALRAEQFAVDAAQRLRDMVGREPAAEEPATPEAHSVQNDLPPQPRTRITASAPEPQPFVPDPRMTPEQQRQAEIRAAVARAKAAREARSTVAPSDGDFDSESEYYRRSTWLD